MLRVSANEAFVGSTAVFYLFLEFFCSCLCMKLYIRRIIEQDNFIICFLKEIFSVAGFYFKKKMAVTLNTAHSQQSLTQQQQQQQQQQTMQNQLLPALAPSDLHSFQSIILQVLKRRENKEIPFVPIGFHQFAPTREEVLIKRMFESCAFKSGMSCVLGK